MNSLCEQCGGGCCKLKLYSVEALAKSGAKSIHYGDETQTISDGYIQMNKVCDKLVGGKCSIYCDRPQTCRDFTVGSKKCLIVMKVMNRELYNKIKGEYNG